MGMNACGIDFRVERDKIEVTNSSGVYPDPRWQYVDRQGHLHTATNFLKSTTGVRESHVDVDGEYTVEVRRTCAICGETITPGTFTSDAEQFIMGLLRTYVNDCPIPAPLFIDLYHWATGEKLALE